MPAYRGEFVKAIEEDVDQKLIKKVEEIQASIVVIRTQLKEHGLIPTNHGDKDDCTSSINTDESLESCIQQLIN